MMDLLYVQRPIQDYSVTHICIICSVSIASGHVAGLFVISEKFKVILKILLLGTLC